MSDVPLIALLRTSSAVTAILGEGKAIRVYEFGQAPTNVARPYVTYQLTTGFPNNNLSDLPDNDQVSTQVDIYATTPQSAKALKDAMRDIIETVTHIASWDGEGRDTATTDYRITFSIDWFVFR